jgi:ABC-type transporter Mla subunit MlaD
MKKLLGLAVLVAFSLVGTPVATTQKPHKTTYKLVLPNSSGFYPCTCEEHDYYYV